MAYFKSSLIGNFSCSNLALQVKWSVWDLLIGEKKIINTKNFAYFNKYSIIKIWRTLLLNVTQSENHEIKQYSTKKLIFNKIKNMLNRSTRNPKIDNYKRRYSNNCWYEKEKLMFIIRKYIFDEFEIQCKRSKNCQFYEI